MTTAVARERRAVSDDEFNRAYYGVEGDDASLRAAADNRNILAGVHQKYRNQLSRDELRTCGLSAMWRCLQYHRAEFGQKFTTSLHRFADWECKRELRRKAGGRGKNRPTMVPLAEATEQITGEKFRRTAREAERREDEARHVRECVDLLACEWQKKLVRQYYFEGLTMEEIGRANGYSKEAARQKLMMAEDALRAILTAQAVY